MSHFYGNLKGSRGEATRCGTPKSGLSVSARSWNGSVTVDLFVLQNGLDMVCIRVADGSAVGGSVVYQSSIKDLVALARERGLK